MSSLAQGSKFSKAMITRKYHYLSGVIITLFVGLHLFNHLWSIQGVKQHLELMDALRPFYRNRIVEILLLSAVVVQIISGLRLFKSNRTFPATFFEKLHHWTGLYLAIFLLIHVGAVLGGRLVLKLDTNFYFGAAGLNTFPYSLFFIPYYGLAIISFFGHLAAVHDKKMKQSLFGLTPRRQAASMLAAGLFITIMIFYGLTNQFKGFAIPKEYGVLIGK